VYRDGFGDLFTFLKRTPGLDSVQLAVLITACVPTFGASHEVQLGADTHAVVVGVVHGRNPRSRALLVWDANILRTERYKSKESLDKNTLQTIRLARKTRKCPSFNTFWINQGQKTNHANKCLALSLDKIMYMAHEGLDVKWSDRGGLLSIGGFQQVKDTDPM
jgi:hypothetical protein